MTYMPEIIVHATDDGWSAAGIVDGGTTVTTASSAIYDPIMDRFVCDCGRTYKADKYLKHHQRWECGKEPSYQCQYCDFKSKRKEGLKRHIERRHPCS